MITPVLGGVLAAAVAASDEATGDDDLEARVVTQGGRHVEVVGDDTQTVATDQGTRHRDALSLAPRHGIRSIVAAVSQADGIEKV